MLLDGQGELGDAIAENGEQLYQIHMVVSDIQKQTIENQRLLKEMSGEYEAERADLKATRDQALKLKAKIESNAGWDANSDGVVESKS